MNKHFIKLALFGLCVMAVASGQMCGTESPTPPAAPEPPPISSPPEDSIQPPLIDINPPITFSLPLNQDTANHTFFDQSIDENGSCRSWKYQTLCSCTKTNECAGTYDGHPGTDFPTTSSGTFIYAAAAGHILQKIDGYGDYDGKPNGNYIVLDHGNGFRTFYVHMLKRTLTPKVMKEEVGCGEYLGAVGLSGDTFGYHLHFGAHFAASPGAERGVPFDPYDGYPYWNQNGHQGVRTPFWASKDKGAVFNTCPQASVRPWIEHIPDQTIPTVQSYTGPVPILTTATRINWTLIKYPPGMTIDSLSGRVSWASPVIGSYPITIRAATTVGFADKTWTLTVVAQPTGACCLPDGGCQKFQVSQCLAAGGTYQGDGSTCAMVNCAATVINDVCPNAIALEQGDSIQGSTIGQTTDGPTLSCELNCDTACNSAPDVWYKFTPTNDGSTTVSLCSNTTYDSIVAVYTGTCDVLTALACNDDGCSGPSGPSKTSFTSIANTTYLIRVTGWKGNSGHYTIRVSHISCPPPVEWEECTCPSTHYCFGVECDGVRYHDPNIYCVSHTCP